MNRFVAECLSRDYDVVTAFDGREGIEQALRFDPTGHRLGHHDAAHQRRRDGRADAARPELQKRPSCCSPPRPMRR